MYNLSSIGNIEKVLAYASGTATRTGTVLDMSGWDGCLFILITATHAASAAGDIHLVAGTSSTLTDSTDDVAGSKITLGENDDDKIFVIDYVNPQYQYVTAVVTKNGANAQAESVVAIQYKGTKAQITDMGASDSLVLIGPAKGTK